MPLSDTIFKYPEDLTGVSPFNLIQDERITIPRTTSRHFAPKHGPFFENSGLVIRTVPGNQLLVKDQDYVVLLQDQLATHKAGQSICYIIAIENPEVYGELAYDYQTVGGNFSTSTSAIKQLIESLEIDNRAIQFDDLIDLPVTFPPSPHTHNVSDLYGFESLVDEVEQIRILIQEGNDAVFDHIDQRLDALVNQINALAELINIDVSNSLSQLQNQITALQNQLNQLRVEFDALKARVDKIDEFRGYIPVASGATLLAGGRYHLSDESMFVFQDVTANTVHSAPLKFGDVIHFITESNMRPLLTVYNQASDRILYRGRTDTVARCNTAKKGMAVYKGQSTWEIHL